MGEQANQKKRVRHICLGLLAHVDAGKTTLSEAILYLTGRIRKLGRVDNRDAFLDTYELERARGITIFSKQAVFSLGDASVTLLDTPGHVDFSTEMERTLQVLDYAVLVINGSDGVQGHTETLWRLLKRYRIPVFLFVNKMDQAGTDRERLLLELKKRLDGAVTDFHGLDGLLSDGGLKDAGSAEHKKSVEETEPDAWTEQRMEELAMCSEELMEQYLETGAVELSQVQKAVANREVFPCYFGSALKVFGVEELLKGIEVFSVCPVYPEKFGARVFKISRDSQGNRLTHLKITGGTLKVKSFLDAEETEKVNQIRIYSGVKFESVNEAEAGMICAVTGPANTRPGQGFGSARASQGPLLEPVLTYQVALPEGCDVHTMLKNLRILEEEDPELHVVWNQVLSEIQIQVMGQIQMEVLKSRIAERFGVDVEFTGGNIVYKETILRAVEGVGHYEPLRHYAEVHLLMEPLETGSGLVFETDCSEDMLDRNWQRLILTHLEERRHRGILTGSEITDMRITLIAGRAHVKHTEGGDFRQATYRAVRQGLKEAGCALLEPYYDFSLEVPAESLGRAMADFERMHGRFSAPEQQGETALLRGSVPVASLGDYQREVAAYTRGRGRLSCSLRGYEACHNEDEVVAKIGYDFESDLQDPAGSVFCSHGAGFSVPWDQVKRYMHVPSPLARIARARAAEEEAERAATGGGRPDPASGMALEENSGPLLKNRGAAGGSGSFGLSYAEDKELEAIFARTFGEPKRYRQGDEDSRRVIRAQETRTPARKKDETEEAEEEYLLVDGYNVIFAWEELGELAKMNIDGARHKLMDILCNYQGYRKCTLILVFDAYKVAGNTGEAIQYHNIYVVYTKEAETADQYIEKLAHKIGSKYKVTVATSDGLEQLIIRGQGCLLLSARDLKEEVDFVNRMIAEEKEKLKSAGKSGKNYLLSHAQGDTREYLEQVRLGDLEADDGGSTGPEKTAATGRDEKSGGFMGTGTDSGRRRSPQRTKEKKS